MKIDFKQPRYVLPLIALPFLCLFFHVYKSSFGKEAPPVRGGDSLRTDVADVSDEVKNRSLSDKLAAYRQQYRDGDGYTAIGRINEEQGDEFRFDDLYNQREKHILDSIDKALDQKQAQVNDPPAGGGNLREDRELAGALSSLTVKSQPRSRDAGQVDPMELFKRQMAYADSMAKANDPDYGAEMKRQQAAGRAEREMRERKTLHVSRTPVTAALFNTVLAEQDDGFIRAIVDENITGYAGSRLRIRLLEDIMAGRFLVKKGTYVYAEVSGFSGQRVLLTIRSIMQDDRLLPVRLEVYDNDGLPGLYVPASVFREFSRELGRSTTQGITLQQQAENNHQLVMGVIQRMFQSTTAAVGKLIRSNKAKLKYNTHVYLIDPEELKANQHNY